MISLSASVSSLMIGESVILTCSVTLLDGVTDTPTFVWEGPGIIPTPSDPFISGQVVNSTLTVNGIRTSQAGQYKCTAITIFNVSDTVEIVVQSKLT